jgi:hypothetical protein
MKPRTARHSLFCWMGVPRRVVEQHPEPDPKRCKLVLLVEDGTASMRSVHTQPTYEPPTTMTFERAEVETMVLFSSDRVRRDMPAASARSAIATVVLIYLLRMLRSMPKGRPACERLRTKSVLSTTAEDMVAAGFPSSQCAYQLRLQNNGDFGISGGKTNPETRTTPATEGQTVFPSTRLHHPKFSE